MRLCVEAVSKKMRALGFNAVYTDVLGAVAAKDIPPDVPPKLPPGIEWWLISLNN